MRKVRFSVLYNEVGRVYIPQYSFDGICWYSIEHPTLHYCRCFKTLEEAKKYIEQCRKKGLYERYQQR